MHWCQETEFLEQYYQSRRKPSHATLAVQASDKISVVLSTRSCWLHSLQSQLKKTLSIKSVICYNCLDNLRRSLRKRYLMVEVHLLPRCLGLDQSGLRTGKNPLRRLMYHRTQHHTRACGWLVHTSLPPASHAWHRQRQGEVFQSGVGERWERVWVSCPLSIGSCSASVSSLYVF